MSKQIENRSRQKETLDFKSSLILVKDIEKEELSRDALRHQSTCEKLSARSKRVVFSLRASTSRPTTFSHRVEQLGEACLHSSWGQLGPPVNSVPGSALP